MIQHSDSGQNPTSDDRIDICCIFFYIHIYIYILYICYALGGDEKRHYLHFIGNQDSSPLDQLILARTNQRFHEDHGFAARLMPMASLETAVALKFIGEAANISGLGVSVVTNGDDTVGTGDLGQLLVPIMTRRTFGLETGDLVFGTGIHRWGMFFCQRAMILEHDISVANKYELVLLRVFVPLRALGSRMRQAVESRFGMPAVIAGGLEFAQRRAFRRHVRPGSDQLEEEKQACEDKCRLLQDCAYPIDAVRRYRGTSITAWLRFVCMSDRPAPLLALEIGPKPVRLQVALLTRLL